MKANHDIYSGSSRIGRLEASPIRVILDRASALREQGHPVIPFSAGEPNFDTPETIKRATIRAIEENHTHYCSNQGLPKLRRLLAKNILEETGVTYDPDRELLVTSSAAEAINNAILSFIEDGDEVILFTPAFVTYKNLVRYAGGTVVDIPLKPENGFQPSPSEVERAITERTKMMILNNPNNPTGAVYGSAVLRKLAELAVEHNLLVLSDEIYSTLVYGDAVFTSMASFPGMKERTLLVNGFSKTYAMTGWRLGYLAAGGQLRTPLLKMHQYSTTCSPTFIQKGLVDSLESPETLRDVQAMKSAFEKRRQRMLEGLNAIKGLSCVVPDGAFYIMVDVSATALSGMEFADRLLEEQYVATVPAIGLGDTCGDFIRISYAASDDEITEGLERIRTFVSSL